MVLFKKNVVVILLLSCFGLFVTENCRSSSNGLLIFLDDSEVNSGKIGAIGLECAKALSEPVGPVAVSTSLLLFLCAPKESEEDSIKEIHQSIAQYQLTELEADYEALIRVFCKLIQRKVADTAGLDEKIFHEKWIVKTVDSHLTLLIPRGQYLQQRGIAPQSVEEYESSASVTVTERLLGLKVNHMATTTLSALEKPKTRLYADYFVQAVWNIKEQKSLLFVTNNEYAREEDIPQWSFFMTGHGVINHSMAHMSPQQFKKVLKYFDEKIHTKVLFYTTCYASGFNTTLAYKDVTSVTYEDHSYPIVFQGLSETSTSIEILHDFQGSIFNDADLQKNISELGKLPLVDFKEFFHALVQEDSTDYEKVTRYLVSGKEGDALNSLHQIKYPGLPWFSVLQSNKVVAIGSLLAKSRTAPLNVGSYFLQRNQTEQTDGALSPIGILLYASDIPFEMIVDCVDSKGQLPLIISMIPGDAVHSIKKISSTNSTAYDLLDSFLKLKGLMPEKLFFIDEVVGVDSSDPQDTVSFTNVVIRLTEKENSIYFVFDDTLYKAAGSITSFEDVYPATDDEFDEYVHFVADYHMHDYLPLTPYMMEKVQKEAEQLFKNPLTPDQAYENIVKVLDSMPNTSLVYVSDVKGIASLEDQADAWKAILERLSYYAAFQMTKRLWITVFGSDNEFFTNVWIKCEQGETTIFFTNDGKYKALQRGHRVKLAQDYMVGAKETFDYFIEHGSLPSVEKAQKMEVRSLYDDLTPQAIARIKKAQEKKLATGALDWAKKEEILIKKDIDNLEREV